MDSPEVAGRCGQGSAWDAYLSDPATTVLGVFDGGEITGIFAIDRISDSSAQVHNLLTRRCSDKAEAVRLGQAHAFGALGYSRLLGKVEADNRPTLHMAAKSGMQRLYEHEGEVYTALNIQDWPWRLERWMRAASGLDGPLGIMLGALCRLTHAGGALRGAALYNEWAAVHEAPMVQVHRYTHDSAIVHCDGAFYLIQPGRVEPIEVTA